MIGVFGWQWHQLDHMRTICTSLRTDNGNAETAGLDIAGHVLLNTF